MASRFGRVRPRVQLQDVVDVAEIFVDDDMTEREDDEQTDHSSSGMAADSPVNHHSETAATTANDATPSVYSPPLHGPQWSPTDSTAVSAEDEDYRSEASSETNSKESPSGATLALKNVSQPFTNYRDLSMRLKRAVHSGGGDCSSEGANSNAEPRAPCFDESMVGADVVLCVQSADTVADSDGRRGIKKFYAHRFMLAASSEVFRAMLTGRMRESAEREVEICGVDEAVVEKMLLYIYTGEVTVDLQNVVGLLIGAEMYELRGLRDICTRFVLVHAQDIFRDPQMVQIPEKVLIEIVEEDNLQIKEIALMEALVMWGEARVASSEVPILEILADVMEHVRFPMMSVSDLYGKVRPLVDDKVIHEALLTEALFYHLKWGTHATKASHRMRPRAGTTALRKRKRVSFIQHVSFLNQ